MNSTRRKALINSLSIAFLPGIFILHNLNYYGSLLIYKESIILFLLYLLVPAFIYFLLRKLARLPTALSALLTLLQSFLFLVPENVPHLVHKARVLKSGVFDFGEFFQKFALFFGEMLWRNQRYGDE